MRLVVCDDHALILDALCMALGGEGHDVDGILHGGLSPFDAAHRRHTAFARVDASPSDRRVA